MTSHYSVISAISSEAVLVNSILRNPEDRSTCMHSFIEYLEEQLLLAMNQFNGENPIMLTLHCYVHTQAIYVPNDFYLPPYIFDL